MRSLFGAGVWPTFEIYNERFASGSSWPPRLLRMTSAVWNLIMLNPSAGSQSGWPPRGESAASKAMLSGEQHGSHTSQSRLHRSLPNRMCRRGGHIEGRRFELHATTTCAPPCGGPPIYRRPAQWGSEPRSLPTWPDLYCGPEATRRISPPSVGDGGLTLGGEFPSCTLGPSCGGVWAASLSSPSGGDD